MSASRPQPSPDHPMRLAMVSELHARPSPRIAAPASVVSLAFKEEHGAAARDRAADIAHLGALALRHGAPAPQQGIQHYAARLGRHELRWESHTEFVSYTATAPGQGPRPFDPALAELFDPAWQAAAPGRRIAATMIHVAHVPDGPGALEASLAHWFALDGLVVSQVLDGAAVIATDFRIDPAGWLRMAVFVRPGVGPGRTGRIVQRLLEIETYRAMSMLGLPRARALNARLNDVDARLTALTGDLAGERASEAVLHDLLGLSARLEGEAVRHSFRFGATKAYEALVDERVAALRESRHEGRQTLTEFMTRRYEPAMRTVRSAETRLSAMLDRAARAGELLRTRVDVERSGEAQALLARMDRRADLQLRLQHTVEGLSVVAISYYALGLLSYALGPLAHAAGIDKGLLTALLVPVVLIAVWIAMRRIRARLHDAPPEA